MAKRSTKIQCSECMNTCTVSGSNADLIAFCPYCGEGVIMPYDDVNDSELFGVDLDDSDNE